MNFAFDTRKLDLTVRTFVALLAAASATQALAQSAPNWPAKPIRWVSPFAAGGSNDIFSRALAARLTEVYGQPVIVENRVGAGGTIGAEVVARSVPDGYTVILGSSPTHAIAPSVYPTLSYDPIRDFVAISMIATVPNVLAVHPSVPAKSVKELIAVARRQPGKLNFASAGNGTTQHLAGELFKVMAGVDMVHVPYKGSVPAIADLIGGQVDLTFDNMPTVLPMVNAGKLRALAVATSRRSATMPELPTISEAGLPGFDASPWFGVFAAAGTPGPIVTRWHAEIVKALAAPEVRDRMKSLGAELVGNSPEAFAAQLRAEIPKWADLVRRAGVKLQ